jgi:NarL family two-component system sensor histidine kinase YdfH
MKNVRAERLLRWLLLLWLGLIYLWGLQLLGLSIGDGALPGGIFPGVSTSSQLLTQPSLQGVNGSLCTPFSLSFSSVLLFTGLMVGHAGLYWLGLSGKIPRRWCFLYLAAQGLLAGMISFSFYLRCAALNPPEDFLICLYLALIVGAISVLDRAKAIIGVVTGYLLLLVMNTVVLESRNALQNSAQGSTQSSIWYAAMILFVVGYIIVYLQQLRTHLQLQVTHARLKASAEKIEELTLANERQRLARDLHDTLAQGLAGVAMQLEAANTHLSLHHTATAQEIVQQAILCAREALIDARGAIDDLRAKQTSIAEITADLQKEVDRFVVAASIPCIADISHGLSVPPLTSEHVLGILREGLTNAARHAQAHQVRVFFGPRGDALTLEIDDDGVGFDPAIAAQSGHYGLIGVRERARLLGGYLTIRSAPGMGTSLQLLLPRKQETWGIPEPDPVRHEKETEREDLHV